MKEKTAKDGIARALHQQNLKRYKPIQTNEGVGWDKLSEGKTCPECGKDLEVNLWKQLVCGYCKGWRGE
jgi:hypothetical protein